MIASPITIIGAGIIGLTTAIRLAEAGYKVRFLAEHFTPDTTSDGAAAVWEPFAVEPRDKVTPWAVKTFAVLKEHAQQTESGVFPVNFNHFTFKEDPWWAHLVQSRWVDLTTPAGAAAHCFRYQSYIVGMSIYMPWLHQKAQKLGVVFEQKVVSDLTTLTDPIVLCVGNGACTLLNDAELKPVRGVVLTYAGNLTEDIWLDGSNIDALMYIIPRRHETIVGGTYEPNETSTIVDEQTVQAIQERAIKILPILARRKPAKIWAGFRPVRNPVRVERGEINGQPVIYNYGHGGGGLTLSWGCADKVVELLR